MKMPAPIQFLLRGSAWTIGSYGVSQVLRLVTNMSLGAAIGPRLIWHHVDRQ